MPENTDDRAEWPPEEKQSYDSYSIGISDGFGLREMSLVAVDAGIRIIVSEGRDFIVKTLSPDMARRIACWMLDHAKEEKQSSYGASHHDPSQGDD